MTIDPEFAKATEWLAAVVTVFGFPLAILTLYFSSRKDLEQRESAAYDGLDEGYLGFLRLAIEHPQLGLYPKPVPAPGLTPDQQIQRAAMFEAMLSLFERAFIHRHNSSSRRHRAQWGGWHSYMKSWAEQPEFWTLFDAVNGAQYDLEFVAELEPFRKKGRFEVVADP